MRKILYIGNALSSHGSNPTSIETLGPLLERNGFDVKYASSKKSKMYRLIDMISTTIRNVNQVDFVIIDTYSTQNFWYAFMVSQICRIAKCNYIPILHGGYLPARIKKNPRISKMIFQNAFINVAPSGFMLHEMKKAGFDNVQLIPNQIDIIQYDFKDRQTFAPKLLWVRSLSDIYNPKMAVYALSEIQKTYPRAFLCMVGPNGGELDEVQSLAKSLNVSVEFTGKLTKQQWIARSKNFDVFLNTSRTDNTPISIIEAMALGLPVISSNVGGIPFLIEDGKTGLLVDDNNAEQMANKVIFLLNNVEIGKSIAMNARQKVEEFDAENVTQQWFKILK